MTFQIAPVFPLHSQVATAKQGDSLVHKADRSALVAIHKATATVPDGYMDAFELVLDTTRYGDDEFHGNDTLYSDDFRSFTWSSCSGLHSGVNLSKKLPPEFVEQYDVCARIDMAGRVNELKILPSVHLDAHRQRVLNLPAAITSLKYLKSLTLSSCKIMSLPLDLLSKLPNLLNLDLFDLEFNQSPSKLFSSEIKLRHLKSLSVSGKDLPSYPIFFDWVQCCLPNLVELDIKNFKNSKYALMQDNVGFPSTIQFISFYNCGIDESQLETLVFGVVPNCPSIKSFDLRGNKIKSFQSIHRRIQAVNIKSSRLRSLLLNGNPIEEILWTRQPFEDHLEEDNQDEIAAVCGFLCAVPTITSMLTYGVKNPDVEMELYLNLRGRCLLENKNLPISVWPLVLVKFQQRFYTRSVAARALFYFLRNRPVFFVRNDCQRKEDRCADQGH